MDTRNNTPVTEVNRAFYDPLWAGTDLISPERFNTWPVVRRHSGETSRRLEIGPGLRPRLPVSGTHFVDISSAALARLAAQGGRVSSASIEALPFTDNSFDLLCALDIVEHVENDGAALGELARVAMPGATVLLSVPLHPEYWTAFDDFVGHYRRYRPGELTALLDSHGLEIEQSAVFGMKPKSSRLVNLGMWFLINRPEKALWWYNQVFMPLGLRFQKPLDLQPNLVDTDGVDDIFLVCRRR